MREDIDTPLRSTKLIILAESSDEMCAIIQSRIGNMPRRSGIISMFDADGFKIGIPISGVPCSVLIPYKLANGSICFNLIMSRSFAGLPNIVAVFSGQITTIVMNHNITNWISGTSRSEMSIDNLDFISVKSFPRLHD